MPTTITMDGRPIMANVPAGPAVTVLPSGALHFGPVTWPSWWTPVFEEPEP